MKKLRSNYLLAICLLALVGMDVSAAAERGQITDSPMGAQAPSLCAATDTVIFSCPLAGRKTFASLCASGTGSPTKFHYAYGRRSGIELLFPPEGSRPTTSFKRTHLVYAGATGGTAYSFTRDGYKYVLYSISGTGLRDGGVLIQHIGSAHAIQDLKCEATRITESGDQAMIGAMLKWKADPDIESAGLPHVKK